MHRPPPLTFARFVACAENHSALTAVREVAQALVSERTAKLPNPLLLHGPSGTGKTHMINALVAEATRLCRGLIATVLPAFELGDCFTSQAEGGRPPIAQNRDEDSKAGAESLDRLKQSDLVIVEDIQHLPARFAENLVQLIDELVGLHCPVVFTATTGPRNLDNLSGRLVSRLIGGLIVSLEPLAAPGRLAFLQDKAQRRQLAVAHEVLAWLAERLTGGGRQLEGAIAKLETLARFQPGILDLNTVASHFEVEVESNRPTVEKIASQVGGYFQVEPRQMQSRRRSRQVVVPRQVGMYLARQLTHLSLNQIGAYFGGRDHSTVLHACRKVEQAMGKDAVLSGAVRQLQMDLT